jgi:hypothetical protein
VVALGWLGTAAAETFTVTTLADQGAGSLRDAVDRANANPGPDVIRFALSGTLVLGSPLIVRDDLRIDGVDQQVVLSGARSTTLLVLPDAHKTLEVVRLTLRQAVSNASTGGAILARGNLRVVESLFADNVAPVGGALYASGAWLEVVNATFADNHALSWGGAIAVSPTTQATVTHSTFVNNHAAQFGGALFQNPIYPGSTVVTAQPVSAVQAPPQAVPGGITVRNSVISGVLAQGNCSVISNRIVDGGGNLNSDDSCPFEPGKGSQNGVNPMLGPLADNGGPTWTVVPLPGSPAIDGGVDRVSQSLQGTALPTDQRGQRRHAGLRVDRGAVEVQARERSASLLPDASQMAVPSVPPVPSVPAVQLAAPALATAPAVVGAIAPAGTGTPAAALAEAASRAAESSVTPRKPTAKAKRPRKAPARDDSAGSPADRAAAAPAPGPAPRPGDTTLAARRSSNP